MASEKQAFSLDFNVDFDAVLTNPILDIGARVWEPDRYAAFKTCYRSMRVIDDLVDNRKESGVPLSPEEKQRYETALETWLEALSDGTGSDPAMIELMTSMKRFRIPVWPWEKLARAMRYDLNYDGFASLLEFRRYAGVPP